jgi:sugar/nucleoside kinase (ribokinase family)
MKSNKIVVNIGGANGERVLRIMEPSRFRLGEKHMLPPPKKPILAGGSAVNQACRLLSVGVQAYPIAPIVNDDVGKVILKTLQEHAPNNNIKNSLNSIYMPNNNFTTPFTTILTVGAQRTILTEIRDDIIEAYRGHYDQQIKSFLKSDSCVSEKKRFPDAVMISHIHADRLQKIDESISTKKRGEPGQSGGITQSIIETFSKKKAIIYANFGSSQYKLGTSRWKNMLPYLDCFQLDIDEIRSFCSDVEGLDTLENILNWFKNRCTVIITMERMGAVARLKNSKNIVVAWPYNLRSEQIKDTTGAGDAFAAGVVDHMLDRQLTDDKGLCNAMINGNLWGAFACTTEGGANNCPSRSELENFKRENSLILEAEIKTMDEIKPNLLIFDRIFLRG